MGYLGQIFVFVSCGVPSGPLSQPPQLKFAYGLSMVNKKIVRSLGHMVLGRQILG